MYVIFTRLSNRKFIVIHDRVTGGVVHEKNFPAAQYAAQALDGISGAFGVPERPSHFEESPPQGQSAPCSLKAVEFGFSSEVRLKSGWQFDLIFRTGRRETGDLVRIFFVDAADSRTRIGVTVGRKIAKASKRVRGRRILREAFRRLLPDIRDGVWIIGSLRENALELSARDIYLDIARSLKRRGLLRPDWPGADWEIDRKGKQ